MTYLANNLATNEHASSKGLSFWKSNWECSYPSSDKDYYDGSEYEPHEQRQTNL